MGKDRIKEKEFIRLVNESQGILHKVCRLYCDDDLHRKDLLQEMLIQLWRSYPSFRGEAKFSSWMYRVAFNVAMQDFRKEKKRKLLFLTSYDFKDPVVTPGSNFTAEKIEQLYAAISELNKVEKAIIILHLDEVSNEEIAQIVGISQNYVRVKMNRIKTKLTKKLKPE